mmetsp:Transcript_22537/g.70700  ORF Transcript_22537/g.70700 Transcript_22537/m.70700 type:complete len:202 (-) Transcript_22537:127-732(-)
MWHVPHAALLPGALRRRLVRALAHLVQPDGPVRLLASRLLAHAQLLAVLVHHRALEPVEPRRHLLRGRAVGRGSELADRLEQLEQRGVVAAKGGDAGRRAVLVARRAAAALAAAAAAHQHDVRRLALGRDGVLGDALHQRRVPSAEEARAHLLLPAAGLVLEALLGHPVPVEQLLLVRAKLCAEALAAGEVRGASVADPPS